MRHDGIVRWFLSLLAVCPVGAVYVLGDPAAEVPEYCTLFHHQVSHTRTSTIDDLSAHSLCLKTYSSIFVLFVVSPYAQTLLRTIVDYPLKSKTMFSQAS